MDEPSLYQVPRFPLDSPAGYYRDPAADGCIDLYTVAVAAVSRDCPCFVAMVLTAEPDDVIGATIRYDNSFSFTTDHLLSMLTAISGQPISPELVLSDESRCSTIGVLTGSQRLRLLLSVNTWQFSRSLAVPEVADGPQISLRFRCPLAAQFETFALKTVLSFCPATVLCVRRRVVRFWSISRRMSIGSLKSRICFFPTRTRGSSTRTSRAMVWTQH
jgi:hypothetical protein